MSDISQSRLGLPFRSTHALTPEVLDWSDMRVMRQLSIQVEYARSHTYIPLVAEIV